MPWHLNSLPRPPILPPHSGHTQLRMPETTSAVALTVLHLINIIHTPPITPNYQRSLTPFRREIPRDFGTFPTVPKRESQNCCVHFQFQNARREFVTRFKWAQKWFA